MTDAILEELNRAAIDDVVLLHRYPPEGVQTPSYFGDAPRLPDKLDWPVSASTGNRMSFLAQIDLGSLPSAMQSRSLLPSEGTLFFFADTNLETYDDTDWSRVLFVPHSCVVTPKRNAPDDLLPIYSGATYHVARWLVRNDDILPAPRLFPYWPVEPRVMRTFPEYWPHRPGGPSREEINAVRWKEESRFRAAMFGPMTPRDSMHSYFADREGRPGRSYLPPPGYPLSVPKKGAAWLPDDMWPYSWVFAATLCAELLSDRHCGFLRSQEFLDQTSTWRQAVRHAGPFTPMPEADRVRFRAWVQAMPIQRADAPPGVGFEIPSLRLTSSIAAAIRSSVDACLGYAGTDKGLFPDYLLPISASRHEPSRRTRHQLFGAARSIQSAAAEYGGSHLPLAQLDTDYGCFWSWGDAGVAQFWITPQDLADLRFDRAIMTLEGG